MRGRWCAALCHDLLQGVLRIVHNAVDDGNLLPLLHLIDHKISQALVWALDLSSSHLL
jgi:hypothetical protein